MVPVSDFDLSHHVSRFADAPSEPEAAIPIVPCDEEASPWVPIAIGVFYVGFGLVILVMAVCDAS